MASVLQSNFDILRRPRITEKTAIENSMNNSVVFDVHPDATKGQIREAVEKIFDVEVEGVRTVNYRGKIKRVGKNLGMQPSWKKAYVTLKEGDALNIVEGL